MILKPCEIILKSFEQIFHSSHSTAGRSADDPYDPYDNIIFCMLDICLFIYLATRLFQLSRCLFVVRCLLFVRVSVCVCVCGAQLHAAERMFSLDVLSTA